MELLQQAYNREDYLDFLNDRFNFSRSLTPVPIDNNEVKSFEQLGKITTGDEKELPVFEIHIKPNTRLSRNRVQLRNLVAKEIKTEDGALAVYVDIPNNQWRFSFIAIEWQLTDEGIKEQQTASKRFTYLLGENTQTRTAKDRFGQLNKQSTLENLKQAFAVEPLNKEFYDKLYKWYEKAQKQVVFPNDEQAENHTQTSLIRLLTRLLFIWFIKEKKLINAELFDKDKLQKLIHYDQPSSFYKAILQNLFFATLSTEINHRDFRRESEFQGKNKDYGNQYRYRYHYLVKDENRWKNVFSKTPFLNGGLFESLDRKLDKNNDDDKKLIDEWNANTRPEKTMLRMEGFSERLKNPLAIPNDLFFNNDEQNLGLIDLFNQYQFTVEESTPSDVEVALDPELLGKVFENLLASYNPETRQQARKATGSFYTPREIVSYMVDESLKAYLTQTVPPEDGDNEFYQERIKDLFEASDNTGEFKKQDGTELIYPDEIPKLIKAISQIKILDPAVGSGAYPMGILQRMVALLSVLDPDNEHWKKEQLAIIDGLTDTISHARARKDIEAVFSAENANNNYGRKLYLIEKCIYGVDIQSVAILITQLRFFISLAIEQTLTADKDKNFGIQPLPNLDYHFEVGNSLIGLPNNYHTGRLEELLRETGELKHQAFSENDHKKKAEIKRQIKEKTEQCYQKIEESIGYRVKFDFRINLSEVFDVNDGFDIVIGNPPYIKEYTNKEAFNGFRNSKYYQGKMDLWYGFACVGLDLLKQKGIECFIAQNNWTTSSGASVFRNKVLKETEIKLFTDFWNYKVFKSAGIQTMTYLLKKEIPRNHYPLKYSLLKDDSIKEKELSDFLDFNVDDDLYEKYTLNFNGSLYYDSLITFNNPRIDNVLNSILNNDIDYLKDNEVANGIHSHYDFVAKKMLFKLDSAFNVGDGIFGINHYELEKLNLNEEENYFLKRYYPDTSKFQKYFGAISDDKYIIYTDSSFNKSNSLDEYPNLKRHLDKFKGIITSDNKPYGLHRARKENFFIGEKIAVQRKCPSEPIFTYLDFDSYLSATFYVIKTNRFNLKWLTALLNSKLVAFWLRYKGKMQGNNYQIDKEPLVNIPIPKISQSEQQPFIDLVDKILTAKQQGQDTTALEAQIDQMVYKLYQLTTDEIKIIEAKK